jgi:hypothetical protein
MLPTITLLLSLMVLESYLLLIECYRLFGCHIRYPQTRDP